MLLTIYFPSSHLAERDVAAWALVKLIQPSAFRKSAGTHLRSSLLLSDRKERQGCSLQRAGSSRVPLNWSWQEFASPRNPVCHVKLPHTEPQVTETWLSFKRQHGRKPLATSRPRLKIWGASSPGQPPVRCHSTIPAKMESAPGPSSDLDKSVSLSGCPEAWRYSCQYYHENSQHSLPPKKGKLSWHGDQKTTGSDAGIPWLLRAVIRELVPASPDTKMGAGKKCPRPPTPPPIIKLHEGAKGAK